MRFIFNEVNTKARIFRLSPISFPFLHELNSANINRPYHEIFATTNKEFKSVISEDLLNSI